MRAKVWMTGFLAMVLLFVLPVSGLVFAGDLDDGISKYKDEAISADDQATKTDTNINFIVLDAIATSQKRQKEGNANTNFNDGSGDNNENSVVVGPGSNVDKVINVNVGRP